MKKVRGFSLIELMTVVAIVGILLTIAMPSYQSYTMRSHRADAQSELVDISARQERFLSQNNTYTVDIITAAGLNLGSATSSDGYYNLAVAACGGGTIATCYLITATAIGPQAGDAECATITLSSTGVKSGTTPGTCWQ
jgi:type IV pilus assembly protein PilE